MTLFTVSRPCCYPLISFRFLHPPAGPPAPLSWRNGEELPYSQASFREMDWPIVYLIYIKIVIFRESCKLEEVQTQRILHICEQIVCYEQTIVCLKLIILAPTPRETKLTGTAHVRYSGSQNLRVIPSHLTELKWMGVGQL